MSDGAVLNFIPSGPVVDAYMRCQLPVKFIMGPVGSGKTSGVMVDEIQIAARQAPSKIAFEYVGGAKLPIRYTKTLFVRETFRQLWGTTIPSWWKWMAKENGEWRGAGAEPARHALRWILPPDKVCEAGSIVDLQVMFEALGDQNVEGLFRGKEFNRLVLNEADTLSPEVYSQGVLRVMQGRYPGGRHVDPVQSVKGVGGDFNAPDIENYLYQLLEEKRPPHIGFFKQPGGLDPRAENRANATREGYEAMERDMIAQGREDLARRMIHNQYGYTRDGEPVYLQYRDDVHCAGVELMPAAGLVVKVDFDQGLKPGAVLRQIMPDGQLRILDELYSAAGADDLCRQLRALIGSAKYAGFKVMGGMADPAANARSGNDAESWLDCVNRLMGWTGAMRVRVAPTNDPDRRWGAVRWRLRTFVGDGKPAILISTTCRVLRKGFNSSYRFKKIVGKRGEYSDRADKVFPVADVHDALQYGALDDGGYEEVVGREQRARRAGASGMAVAKMAVKI